MLKFGRFYRQYQISVFCWKNWRTCQHEALFPRVDHSQPELAVSFSRPSAVFSSSSQCFPSFSPSSWPGQLSSFLSPALWVTGPGLDTAIVEETQLLDMGTAPLSLTLLPNGSAHPEPLCPNGCVLCYILPLLTEQLRWVPDTRVVSSLADSDTCLLGPGGGKCAEPTKLSLLAVKTEKYSMNQQVGDGSVPGRGQRSHWSPQAESGRHLEERSSFWDGWEGVCGPREAVIPWGRERACGQRETNLVLGPRAILVP